MNVKLAIVVEGDPTASFSIDTTHCVVEEGANPFPRLLRLTLDPYLIILSV